MQNLGKVSIIFFKKHPCHACTIIEPTLQDIINTSSLTTILLTFVDTKEEPELADKYNVTAVPHILFNDKTVLTAQMAGELINEGGDAFSIIQDKENTFNVMNKLQQTDSFSESKSSFSENEKTMFNNNAVFNHLFNCLIEASVESSEDTMIRLQKLIMLEISQKSMTPEAIHKLKRVSLGDYVHIGVLQSIVTSILSINPASRQYLYEAGINMGKYSNTQSRFLVANPRLMEPIASHIKFQDLLEGLQGLYSGNSVDLPLYLVSRSLVVSQEKYKAKLQVYDSAYAVKMGYIAQSVCYLIAGEIAGLIETVIGEEKVSVIETKCWGLGDMYCEFDIEIGKKRDFTLEKSRLFLSKKEKSVFQNSLNLITDNMYKSSLFRTILRPGIGDYVHISILQQALNGIKFSDPFFSSLLFYAGMHQGRVGADYEIMKRIMKKKEIETPLDFEEAGELLQLYFKDPSTVLTRFYGETFFEVEDEETIKLKIVESAISSGLNLKDIMGLEFNIDKEKAVLCNFTAGFIQGRLERVTDETISVKEINCISIDSKYCEFLIEMN